MTVTEKNTCRACGTEKNIGTYHLQETLFGCSVRVYTYQCRKCKEKWEVEEENE